MSSSIVLYALLIAAATALGLEAFETRRPQVMSEKGVGDRARPRHPYGNVPQLARRELQRTWPSYLTSGVLNLLFGLLTLSLVLESAAPGEVGFPEISVAAFPADLLLVVFLAKL